MDYNDYSYSMENTPVYIYSYHARSYSFYVWVGNKTTPRAGDYVHAHFNQPHGGPKVGGGKSNNNVNHPT